MKKTFILCLLTLLIGAALGWGVGQFANPALPRAASPAALITAPASAAPQAALDQGDNGPLLERGQAVLKAMKARDYPALAALAHLHEQLFHVGRINRLVIDDRQRLHLIIH